MAFVLYYLLKHRSKLFHAFPCAEAAIEDVIYHVSDRHFDVVSFVDFFDACSCVIALRYHCHFVEGTLSSMAVADELSQSAVAAER